MISELAEAEFWGELSSDSSTCEHHNSDSVSSNSSLSMVPTDIKLKCLYSQFFRDTNVGCLEVE